MDEDRPFSPLKIDIPSPQWDETAKTTQRAMRLTAQINRLTYDDLAQVRELFSELTLQSIDEGFALIPPFYSSYGLDIRVGKKVFINQGCTIYDMGGVEIGDRVMIGPNVSLITTSHPLEPDLRRAYIEAKPIKIENNVWIAAGVTIIGGVTIGENSAIGAGAVVTKNVPPNCFVAGSPAKIIRKLDRTEE